MNYRNNRGSIAMSVFLVVIALIVAGAIILAHHYYFPHMATESSIVSSTIAVQNSTVIVTAVQPTTTSSGDSETANFMNDLEKCSVASGTLSATSDILPGTMTLDVNVLISGTSDQDCHINARITKLVSFAQSPQSEGVNEWTAASTSQLESDLQTQLSSAPLDHCSIPQGQLSTTVATFDDPVQFGNFLNSSYCADYQADQNRTILNTSQIASSSVINNASVTVTDGTTATINGVTISVSSITYYQADEATVNVLAGDNGSLSSYQFVYGGDPSDDVTQAILSHHLLTITSATDIFATFTVTPNQ